MVSITISVPMLLLMLLSVFGPVSFLGFWLSKSQRERVGLIEGEKYSAQERKNQQQAQIAALERDRNFLQGRESAQQATIAALTRENALLREELLESKDREKQARADSFKAGRSEALSSIKVLTTTKHRILSGGLLRTTTERSNLFIVLAGGEFRSGYLGEEALTEDQLLKLLETMKIVTDLAGYKLGSAVSDALKKFLDRKHLS